ncbi:MAG: HepT-like ribonuclease domain-containing protein [Patescibacteria group bacterium]
MLDKEFIKIKIEYIQRDLNRLEVMRDLTIDEIAKDFIKYGALKNFLVEIIGRAIDINEHIIAEAGNVKLEAPLKYRETFLRLIDLDILPPDFADEIAGSARLRNAIVHDYNTLDKYFLDKKMSIIIQQYAQYCDYILKFLEKAK